MLTVKTTSHIQTYIDLMNGTPIIIGRTYSGIRLINPGEDWNEPAAVLSWENETLLVGFQDCRHFVFLGGDLAASEDQILARGKVSEIWFAQDLQHFWKDEETEEGRLMALRRHFPKVPSVLLERIVKIQAYRSTSDRI